MCLGSFGLNVGVRIPTPIAEKWIRYRQVRTSHLVPVIRVLHRADRSGMPPHADQNSVKPPLRLRVREEPLRDPCLQTADVSRVLVREDARHWTLDARRQIQAADGPLSIQPSPFLQLVLKTRLPGRETRKLEAKEISRSTSNSPTPRRSH